MIDLSPPATPTAVLVVDDERTTRLAITEALCQIGFLAEAARSGEEAVQRFQEKIWPVVILDLEMPGIKGVDILNMAESIAPQTAFIILTAHASTDTAITALRNGAVDYLRKPSSLHTIIAAVSKAAKKKEEQLRHDQAMALLQQAMQTLNSSTTKTLAPSPPSRHSVASSLIQVGQLHIDPDKQHAQYKNKSLELTPIEFSLLHHLALHPDTVQSFTQLGIASHQVEMDELEARALLRTHMYRLARKLDKKEKTPIQSVWGRGFVLNST